METKQAQHTKGPFYLDVVDGPQTPQIHSDKGIVASLTTVGEFQAAQTEQEVMANAHLLKSAPELLNALRVAKTVLQTNSKLTPGEFSQIQTAIRHAEGRL